ncbi:hypothetical protein MNEG_3596, partial [Monoraphidium neglectum]
QQPPGSGGGSGRFAVGDTGSSSDEIFVADESKLAVLFGSGGGAGGGSGGGGGAGALQPSIPTRTQLQPPHSPMAMSLTAEPSSGGGAAAALGLVAAPHQQRPLPVKPGAVAAAGSVLPPPRIGAGSMSPTRVRSPQPGRGGA